MIRKTIHAVTVSKDYLEPKLWAVKTLSIFYRKDTTPFWFVRGVIARDPKREIMHTRALAYSLEMNILYFDNIRHGTNLTDKQKVIVGIK